MGVDCTVVRGDGTKESVEDLIPAVMNYHIVTIINHIHGNSFDGENVLSVENRCDVYELIGNLTGIYLSDKYYDDEDSYWRKQDFEKMLNTLRYYRDMSDEDNDILHYREEWTTDARAIEKFLEFMIKHNLWIYVF